MNEIPGTLMGILENNSKFNGLIDTFNVKTQEIIEAVKGLHFSTKILRN